MHWQVKAEVRSNVNMLWTQRTAVRQRCWWEGATVTLPAKWLQLGCVAGKFPDKCQKPEAQTEVGQLHKINELVRRTQLRTVDQCFVSMVLHRARQDRDK